ncbi:MAG: Ig-like domain-containing protein [Bacillota bacterium]|nr:Ig-like domain-containing protein [Bacillota bacterium]
MPQADIQANMYKRLTGKEEHLAAYWNMDENSGNIDSNIEEVSVLINAVNAANNPPQPRGDTTVISPAGGEVSILEDSVQPEWPNIRLQVPTLNDPDGVAPFSIRILLVEGGIMQQGDGNSLSLGEDGTILSLTGALLNLRFTPDSNRDTDASFEYVIKDN